MLRTDKVIGGLAWVQRLTTLTGESPTPSLAPPGQPRPINNAKGSGDAAVRRSAPPTAASGVAADVADGNILRLVERFLKAGVMEEGVFRPATVGTPQGGVITPPTMLRTCSVLQQ